jgi:hypothetical protein
MTALTFLDIHSSWVLDSVLITARLQQLSVAGDKHHCMAAWPNLVRVPGLTRLDLLRMPDVPKLPLFPSLTTLSIVIGCVKTLLHPLHLVCLPSLRCSLVCLATFETHTFCWVALEASTNHLL